MPTFRVDSPHWLPVTADRLQRDLRMNFNSVFITIATRFDCCDEQAVANVCTPYTSILCPLSPPSGKIYTRLRVYISMMEFGRQAAVGKVCAQSASLPRQQPRRQSPHRVLDGVVDSQAESSHLGVDPPGLKR